MADPTQNPFRQRAVGLRREYDPEFEDPGGYSFWDHLGGFIGRRMDAEPFPEFDLERLDEEQLRSFMARPKEERVLIMSQNPENFIRLNARQLQFLVGEEDPQVMRPFEATDRISGEPTLVTPRQFNEDPERYGPKAKDPAKPFAAIETATGREVFITPKDFREHPEKYKPRPARPIAEVKVDLGSTAKNQIEVSAINQANSRDALLGVKEAFDPDLLTFAAKWKGTEVRIKDFLAGAIPGVSKPTDEEREFLTKLSTLTSRTYGVVNARLKEMSGVAVNPQEAERLAQELASMQDTPIPFAAKLDEAILAANFGVAKTILWEQMRESDRTTRPWQLSRISVAKTMVEQQRAAYDALTQAGLEPEEAFDQSIVAVEKGFSIPEGYYAKMVQSIGGSR